MQSQLNPAGYIPFTKYEYARTKLVDDVKTKG